MEKELIRGGQFIVKNSKCEDIFTPEDFTEEQKMMKDAVMEFNDREIIPFRDRFENKDYAFTEEVMRKAGALGFLGVAVPEAYGGLGMGFVSSLLTCDYISSGTGSFSTAFGAHTGIGTMPITLYGSEEQKQKYVPKLASGEWFGSYCLTEPTAGSDANSGRTKAVLSEDGTHYKISGQKMWISNAGFCKLFIVFARIEDDKNITGFLVENDPNNGISLGEEEHKLGIHASSTRQVFFTDTEVPVENMLSERGNGFKIAMNSLNIGRIKLAGACLDSQRRITSYAIQYASERKQFNTPIAEFGAIKAKIAEMATNTYVGESATYRASKDIENRIEIRQAEGDTHQDAELKGVEEFAIECSILKVSVSEDVQSCADEGIQIFGGMGFSAETPAESAWRDSRIGRIYEGTNEINRMLIIGMLLKKAMKGSLDIMTPYQNIINNKPLSITEKSDELNDEITLVENFKSVFLLLLGKAFEKYGPEIDKNQQVLLSLSDLAIETYLSESTLKRTIKNIERTSDKDQSDQINMTRLYIYEASQIVQKKSRDVVNSIIDMGEQDDLYSSIIEKLHYSENPNVFDLKTKIANKLISENKYCF